MTETGIWSRRKLIFFAAIGTFPGIVIKNINSQRADVVLYIPTAQIR